MAQRGKYTVDSAHNTMLTFHHFHKIHTKMTLNTISIVSMWICVVAVEFSWRNRSLRTYTLFDLRCHIIHALFSCCQDFYAPVLKEKKVLSGLWMTRSTDHSPVFLQYEGLMYSTMRGDRLSSWPLPIYLLTTIANWTNVVQNGLCITTILTLKIE